MRQARWGLPKLDKKDYVIFLGILAILAGVATLLFYKKYEFYEETLIAHRNTEYTAISRIEFRQKKKEYNCFYIDTSNNLADTWQKIGLGKTTLISKLRKTMDFDYVVIGQDGSETRYSGTVYRQLPNSVFVTRYDATSNPFVIRVPGWGKRLRYLFAQSRCANLIKENEAG